MSEDGSIISCPSCGNEMDISSIPPFSMAACPSCGMSTRVHTRMGQFELESRLGYGGMSIVFAAKDLNLDRDVAVKILNETYSSSPNRIRKFEHEAHVMASVSHPNIVKVYTVGQDFGRYYIAMELVSGGNLEKMILEQDKLPELEVLKLGIQIAEGLLAAYEVGLLHRDMKPANILLDQQGTARIVDFGLALLVDNQEQEEEIWATPYYCSPETLEREPEDFRSDIYALGATLYHALAGVAPCQEAGTSIRKLKEAKRNLPSLSEVVPWVSAETCAVIDRCLAFSPSDRFSSYPDFIDAMAKARKKAALYPNKSIHLHANGKKKKLILAGSVVGLALVASGIAFFSGNSDKPEQTTVTSSDKSEKNQAEDPFDGASDTKSDKATANRPAMSNESVQEIQKHYQQARSDLASNRFEKASEEYAKVARISNVPLATACWALLEGALCELQLGNGDKARTLLNEISLRCQSQSKEKTMQTEALLGLSRKLIALAPLKSEDLIQYNTIVLAPFASAVKNWEMGRFQEAQGQFSAFISGTPVGDKAWLRTYHQLAQKYLDDFALMKSVEGLGESTLDELLVKRERIDALRSTLKTSGRILMWRNEFEESMARAYVALQNKQNSPTTPGDSNEPAAVVAFSAEDYDEVWKLMEELNFKEASTLISKVQNFGDYESQLETLKEMLVEAEAFKVNLIHGVQDNPDVVGTLKSRIGQIAKFSGFDAKGEPMLTFSGGHDEKSEWKTILPESWIEIHQKLIKKIKDENERNIRHSRAIAFLWLSGDKDKAQKVAVIQGKNDAVFKSKWERWMETLN